MQRPLFALVPLALLALLARAFPVRAIEPRADTAQTAPRPQDDAPEAAAPNLSGAIPGDALLFIEAPGLSGLLERGLSDPFIRTALGSPLGKKLIEEGGVSVPERLAWAQRKWGHAPLPTLASLSDRGAALALRARGDSEPATLLLLRTSHTALLDTVLRDSFERIEDAYHVPGAFTRPAETLHGADVWRLGEQLVVARRAGTLWVGNDRGFLLAALALTDSSGGSLLARDAFREALASRNDGQLAWAWVDLPRLAEVGDADLKELRQLAEQPAAQALLGPWLSALPTGHALSFWLDLRGDRLEFGAEAVGAVVPAPLVARASAFSIPPALPLGPDAAEGLLFRDYAAFVGSRAELFAPGLLPGFSEPLSILSLLFGGLDFGEDYLPGLSPWIRVVVRDVDFDPRVAPENPLPAACAVVEMRDPERRGPEAITAFQTLIGLMNTDRAQERGGMMRLSLSLEGRTEVTSAHFLPPGPEDGVDMKYNLAPACALVDSYFVLGTHVELVREVVRRLQQHPVALEPSEAPGENLRVSPARLVSTLDANLDTLVMRKVLDEGKTAEAARGELGGLRLLLSSLESVRLETQGAEDSGRVRGRLAIRLAGAGNER